MYADPSTATAFESSTSATAEVLRRFNEAFLRHEPALLPPLIAPDCVVERSQPTADSTHLVGGPACLAMWLEIAANRNGHFTLEEVVVMGERGLIFWEYRTGPGPAEVSRGLNVMTVRGGRIVEGRGYVKRPA
ncbi:nuclear transport factor 2 family protein [Ideonella sp. BN130291]|uniref:nuclear transport factor 2 family protein n=1 Tax=Ideonella sp. BN130291 TaxID=3112940 RepID=UPI002E255FBB|nr:nuclear transport factor 2 family protein [Ideonella sp. BN130291]